MALLKQNYLENCVTCLKKYFHVIWFLLCLYIWSSLEYLLVVLCLEFGSHICSIWTLLITIDWVTWLTNMSCVFYYFICLFLQEACMYIVFFFSDKICFFNIKENFCSVLKWMRIRAKKKNKVTFNWQMWRFLSCFLWLCTFRSNLSPRVHFLLRLCTGEHLHFVRNTALILKLYLIWSQNTEHFEEEYPSQGRFP